MKAKSTGESSRKFGPCEICREYVSDVYIARGKHPKDSTFGHKECLEAWDGDPEIIREFKRWYHGVSEGEL